jgi:hypothetical protein
MRSLKMLVVHKYTNYVLVYLRIRFALLPRRLRNKNNYFIEMFEVLKKKGE